MLTRFAVLYLCVIGNSVALRVNNHFHTDARTLLDRNASEQHVAGTLVQPSIAIIVLGDHNSSTPMWARPEYNVFLYSPPQSCNQCPSPFPRGDAPGSKYTAGWWCAQRNFFNGLEELVNKFPHADFYLTVDADTMVFPDALNFMLQNIRLEEAQDLFMGDVTEFLLFVGRFILTGGGALMRGLTLRRLVDDGHLNDCQNKVRNDWCWDHLDWMLAKCFRLMNVVPRGHEGFNQWGNCELPVVTCHKVKSVEDQKKLLKQHEDFGSGSFNVSWAQPCPDEVYDFSNSNKCKSHESLCTCTNPGNRNSGMNSLTCSDGQNTNCSANEYCYAVNAFPKGHWDQGCKKL